MNDIIFITPSYLVDMPINTNWNILYIELIPNYYVLRISLPERISIS